MEGCLRPHFHGETMSTRKLISFITILLAGAAVVTASSVGVPRKSPEFTITQASGQETQLASFKGKVVVLEFMFVRSPHCLQLVEMLNKLNGELGSRGFQPLAVAFGPNANEPVLAHLVDYFKVTYPVGYSSSDKVDAYLGRDGKEILKVPQMVVIDRKGVIRATSGTTGDPVLENESSLRAFVDTLLKEKSSSGNGARAALPAAK
jgi:cytochrome oxidase Cu insertion factor (SCO1/SenC/PrrC family)